MENGKNLSVCMLVTNFDAPTGGVQKNSRLLLSEFNKRGIKTFLCARNYYNLPRSEIKNGTRIRRSPVLGSSMAVNSILYLIDAFFWLVANRGKYDVIHCQQMFGPTMVAAIASVFIKKPILTRITLSGETGEANAVRQMSFSGIRLRLLNRVSKWVALTGEMKSELETLDIPPEKIEIIYNATEIPPEAAFETKTREKYRKKLNLEYEKIAVFTGRLSQEKGLDVLINAWKTVAEKYPNAHLLLLGDGGNFRNVENDLKEQSARLGLEKTIHFLGYVSNPKEYLLASDIFVLPSRAEGMSNALVEAMACGAVIVTTGIPAMLELCEDGENALIVKLDDVSELAQAIIKLFDEPQTAYNLAFSARQKAEKDLSIETMISKYIGAYEEIVNN
jgi:glycosyltransferase involved in cell wall biosynthesis